jgi:elongation factor P
MNTETFEEVALGEKIVGDKAKWISEGMEVTLVSFLDKVIEVQIPTVMVYTIIETDPTLKGATVNNYIKPAVLDCGATINVPGYLEQGESIKVDTEKEEFLERNKGV